jgi:hypothetical protein
MVVYWRLQLRPDRFTGTNVLSLWSCEDLIEMSLPCCNRLVRETEACTWDFEDQMP